MKTHHISNWDEWKELCEENGIDPYKYADFGIDLGMGNSENWDYIGDYPEREE